ncbi:MAG TPA: amidohydrolase family protein [Candidatus Limiplasma sp.]|nr:amidohydrolase family protein [Candidatus Limiplasma sp.]
MNFVLKGNFCYSESPERITTLPGGYGICVNGVCEGVFETLPERYAALPLTDMGDRLILPGMCDLHLHAPQFAYRGLGMDLELIEWLNTQAFPEESKYADLAYAKRAYRLFAQALRNSATTRFACFATLHAPATLLLMQTLENLGLRGYVGKVNMDRNSPDTLREGDTAAADTEAWLQEARSRFQHILPIITPRFIPSCTDALMRRLSELAKAYDVPLQSHLSENQAEIRWVRELCPGAKSYADAYDRFGMLGPRTVMAHVVYPEAEEMELLRERGVMVAHCPASNMNIRSGIAPVRKMLSAGVRMGLGTDVAGGQTLDMFRAVTDAVQVSKLHWRLTDQREPALTLPEAFYLATLGGGAFFGKVGTFASQYEFDAVVLDDTGLPHPQPLTVEQRLQRAVYLPEACRIVCKYVAGNRIDTL